MKIITAICMPLMALYAIKIKITPEEHGGDDKDYPYNVLYVIRSNQEHVVSSFLNLFFQNKIFSMG